MSSHIILTVAYSFLFNGLCNFLLPFSSSSNDGTTCEPHLTSAWKARYCLAYMNFQTSRTRSRPSTKALPPFTAAQWICGSTWKEGGIGVIRVWRWLGSGFRAGEHRSAREGTYGKPVPFSQVHCGCMTVPTSDSVREMQGRWRGGLMLRFGVVVGALVKGVRPALNN